jgi:hypothetical protein
MEPGNDSEPVALNPSGSKDRRRVRGEKMRAKRSPTLPLEDSSSGAERRIEKMRAKRSPTRPQGMRRRQSMQLLDLEAKVEELAAENRLLVEAKAQAERNLTVTHTLQPPERELPGEVVGELPLEYPLKMAQEEIHIQKKRIHELEILLQEQRQARVLAQDLAAERLKLSMSQLKSKGLLDTEHLEDERKHYNALIDDFQEELDKAKLALDEAPPRSNNTGSILKNWKWTMKRWYDFTPSRRVIFARKSAFSSISSEARVR